MFVTVYTCIKMCQSTTSGCQPADKMSSALDNILNYQRNQNDDYYYILGCDENSTEEQIAAEYKARVLSCHPDKHQNDEAAHEKFSKLSQAKEVLLDPEKRKEYDKWRQSGLAIPYETWRSMAHVKTSMHWGYRKEQTALEHPDQSVSPSRQRPVSPSIQTQSEPSKNLVELQDKMKFTPREKQASTNPMKGWERDTSNPILQKFRNYQI